MQKIISSWSVIEMSHCAAIIPCFNESASIARLVRAVCEHLPLMIVVDDGSTDGSGALARSAGAMVLTHACNLGKGTALKTGLSHARQLGCEWAVTMDGDGQHASADLPALFQSAQTTRVPLVIGNRMTEAHKMPWLRRQVNRWMSRQLSRRAGCELPDTQSGFRLLHLETWAALPLRTERFETESETLMAFLAAGWRVEFVPVQVIPSRRSSKIHPLADSVRWLKWWSAFKHDCETKSSRHCHPHQTVPGQ